MSEAAIKRPNTYTQIRLLEPAGERTFDGGGLTIGGEGAAVVVPGLAPGAALAIERREGVWVAEAARADAGVRFDGRPLTGARDLRRGDVVALGDAQLTVTAVSRTLLRLTVSHLVGNTTIPPSGEVIARPLEAEDDAEIEIRATGLGAAGPAAEAAEPARTPAAAPTGRSRWLVPAAIALVLLATLLVVSALRPVALDVQPADARIRTPGTFLALHIGERLFVLPGAHTVRAEREGYAPAQTVVSVQGAEEAAARLRLAKLPGRLAIDTGGVPATVSVDGVPAGRAPGEIDVPPGTRTITLRAPRFLDYVATLEVEGAGVRQDLRATLQPSWGTVRITAEPPGALVRIDGVESGVAPASLEVDAGVRRLQVSAPGLKPWESSIVVRAGETLEIGPITLGQPDAQIVVRSRPSGADVAVGGAYRGRTPVTLDLSPGMRHEVVVSMPGHESWRREVLAEPRGRTELDATLTPVLAPVTVQGEPADAEVLVDGVAQGRTPLTLRLSAVEHRIEVRKDGFVPFETTVTPAAGLERRVRYRLTSADRAVALRESAPELRTKDGYVLRLVPPGSFVMGSDRREQGRRPNEGQREVTLERPLYIGATEVTNAQFRRFRPEHSSGYIEKRSFDLDRQPVTRVTWEDAAAYCNWLSEQEGLPPAYERRDGRHVLRRPVTHGYRLPTEAEWEYAARYAAPGQFRRFPWGDSLPIAAGTGNFAGTEAAETVDEVLVGHQDEFPAVAPVASFPANPLGLHDMSGNVSEWVHDYYQSFVGNEAATDPLGPEEGARRVIRGANWQTTAVSELRLAWRDGWDEASPAVGFRIARYAE